MIVREFLQWVRTAPASERAEATSALARAYLYSDLSPDDLAAAEGAMLMLLDDPSPLVRRALADALAASPNAPPAIVFALAADQPQIAAPVYALSPLFVDADLVDAVATGGAAMQAAIASRAALPRSVAAAIAEVGTAESCLVLVENCDADIAPFSIDRIVERFGHLAAIRESLLARDDIPAATRQTLVTKLSETLAGFVAGRAWLDADHAQRMAREACEKATVTIAAETPETELASADPSSVRERAAHGRPHSARAVVRQYRAVRGGAGRTGRHAGRAGIGAGPRSRHVRIAGAVRKSRIAAFDLSRVQGSDRGDARGLSAASRAAPTRLKRRMIERVLTRCEDAELGELAPLLTLLRRFATEAAREEARLFCDELVRSLTEQHSVAAYPAIRSAA